MKYCSNCGNMLADSDSFCNKCGKPQENGVIQPIPSLSPSPVIKAVGKEQREFSAKLQKAVYVMRLLSSVEPMNKQIEAESQYCQGVRSGKIKCGFFPSYLPFFIIGMVVGICVLLLGIMVIPLSLSYGNTSSVYISYGNAPYGYTNSSDFIIFMIIAIVVGILLMVFFLVAGIPLAKNIQLEH